MQVFEGTKDLCRFIQDIRSENKSVSFIPTMGALHEGHLALVREGLKRCDIALVSIFVNPTQFAANEDFDSYPRTLESDIQKLEEGGAHAIWTPQAVDIYPDGPTADIHVSGVSAPLEGAFRPHFFDGVASVVARLLKAVKPDMALFGEKDYQQLQVIQKMALEQNITAQIIGVPTIRDENGLALSSRNSYLSEEEYKIATALNRILFEMADKARAGENFISVEVWGKAALTKAGFQKIDYCTIRDARTLLEPVEGQEKRILAAAWIEQTRLIDNIALA